ncbi:patatin-like phospholipase family protein [Yoonia algicola]|uniref:Patatin-like phospholipase family protein n=1 Tax=Yoonia algicola TaxID=3137368 RepID=A0AAN0M4C6_9RHOB
MHSIALALGAGGARGLAHIHAIRAFDDLGLRPKAIAGTSMGSIIGAAACAGMSADAITDHIFGKISNPLSLVNDAFKVRATSIKRFFEEGGPRIGELNLERILDVVLPDAIPETFAELTIPLKIAATDFYGQRTAVFADGPLLSAMAASAAMPAVFLPVERNGRFHIDGSATNPCPLDLVQDDADHVIAIDVSGGTHGDPTERPSKIDAMYGSNQMMQMSIVQNAAMHYPQTVLLRPPVDSYRALDLLKAKEILEQTAALCEQVKSEIDRLGA